MLKYHCDSSEEIRIDRKRYRKIRGFFAKVFLQAIWWDIILNRPVLGLFRTPALPRWQSVAREYRALAVEMGGVLIKLGQFLSIRVDILPAEITGELAGLQDEVPPEKTEAVIAQIEKDFGCPVSEVFEWISPDPLGAASLAQAHLARVHSSRISPTDSHLSRVEVVVKVLRPGIDVLVETDIKAIALAFRWLKHYKRISHRVDLDWLSEEFTTVTRRELDFESEARNAERLSRDLALDSDVYLPRIYRECCAARTLTMENVGYIRIADLKAIEAAGISRVRVADTLYRIYMKQVFETYFVHVDPHPGNLFVKPLPHPDEIEAGMSDFRPGDPVPYKPDRPFQVVFVDFGMSVEIPERLRSALREYAIAIGTSDAHRLVQSLVKAGVLLEGADLNRLEEAHEMLFRHLWGVQVGKMRDVALKNARFFIKEYKDVIYESPIQFQADTLFVMRAVGMLSGMSAHLDPDFDVWAKTVPFAERYAKEELLKNPEDRVREAVALGHKMLKMPNRLEQMLTQAEQGKLTIQTGFSPDARKSVQRLEQAVSRLSWTVAAAALLIAGANLHTAGKGFGGVFIVLAVLFFLRGMRKE